MQHAPQMGLRNAPTHHTGLTLALIVLLLTALALLMFRQQAAAGPATATLHRQLTTVGSGSDGA